MRSPPENWIPQVPYSHDRDRSPRCRYVCALVRSTRNQGAGALQISEKTRAPFAARLSSNGDLRARHTTVLCLSHSHSFHSQLGRGLFSLQLRPAVRSLSWRKPNTTKHEFLTKYRPPALKELPPVRSSSERRGCCRNSSYTFLRLAGHKLLRRATSPIRLDRGLGD